MKYADIGVAILALATFLLPPVWHDIVLLFCVSYLVWRWSPSRLLTGKRSALDDTMVLIGFIFLQQRFLTGVYSSAGLLIGALTVTVFSFLMVYTTKASRSSMLGRYQKRALWQRWVRSFVLCWALYAIVYAPLVLWSLSSGIFVILAVAWFFIPTPAFPVHTLHTKKGFLLGLAGLLTIHAFVQTFLALFRLGVHPSVQWVLGIIGFVILSFLPLYMWHKTYHVRKSHHHLPDWKSWKTAVVSGILLFPFFWPVVDLGASANGVIVRPLLPTASWIPLLAGTGVALLWFVMGRTDHYIRKVLMAGPFLAGVLFLGTYIYYAFVSSFAAVASTNVALWALPIPVLTFICTAFFLVVGGLSFVYELWRE